MDRYIGTKLIQAEPAIRKGGKVYVEGDAIPKTMEPVEQGYKVVYPDGYVSWSPKDVFEDAYRRTDEMNFGLSVEALKKGERVTRKGWNGKGMWLEIQPPGELSKMTLPYIYMFTADRNRVPWLANQTDVLADDWCIVE